MRWPRPNPATPADTLALLTACQKALTSDGSAIIAVTAAAAGQPGTTYGEHEQLLLTAASAAGLRHLHAIVALVSTDGRDTFIYPAAQQDLPAPDGDTDSDTPRHAHTTTLIIFGKVVTRP